MDYRANRRDRCACRLAVVLAALAIAPVAALAQAPAKVVVLADFSAETPGLVVDNATATRVAADAGGAAYLKLVPRDSNARVSVRMPLPAGMDLATVATLEAALRAEGNVPVVVRWFGLDANNAVIWQRRHEIATRGAWLDGRWPLAKWRWGSQQVGDWADVKTIALTLDSAAAELDLRPVRLVCGDGGRRSALPPDDWLPGVAFEGRKTRIVAEAGLRVATDAVDEFSDESLRTKLGQMKKIAAWAGRLGPAASRPVTPEAPLTLLIFRQKTDWDAFYTRLGKEWNVTIPRPAAGGYTVQDICASTYDANAGLDRAVYFHESAHAVISRQWRLLAGVPAHSWLQEGVANYLQLCVYPQSMDRQHFVRAFAAGIDANSFLRPLNELIGKPIAGRQYAQLASLVAFLVEEHPEWLKTLVAGTAVNQPVAELLNACGTSLPALQEQWLTWGKKTFSSGSNPPRTHFATPREWE